MLHKKGAIWSFFFLFLSTCLRCGSGQKGGSVPRYLPVLNIFLPVGLLLANMGRLSSIFTCVVRQSMIGLFAVLAAGADLVNYGWGGGRVCVSKGEAGVGMGGGGGVPLPM